MICVGVGGPVAGAAPAVRVLDRVRDEPTTFELVEERPPIVGLAVVPERAAGQLFEGGADRTALAEEGQDLVGAAVNQAFTEDVRSGVAGVEPHPVGGA